MTPQLSRVVGVAEAFHPLPTYLSGSMHLYSPSSPVMRNMRCLSDYYGSVSSCELYLYTIRRSAARCFCSRPCNSMLGSGVDAYHSALLLFVHINNTVFPQAMGETHPAMIHGGFRHLAMEAILDSPRSVGLSGFWLHAWRHSFHELSVPLRRFLLCPRIFLGRSLFTLAACYA